MCHVSAQGVGESMINVHYYYYYSMLNFVLAWLIAFIVYIIVTHWGVVFLCICTVEYQPVQNGIFRYMQFMKMLMCHYK